MGALISIQLFYTGSGVEDGGLKSATSFVKGELWRRDRAPVETHKYVTRRNHLL